MGFRGIRKHSYSSSLTKSNPDLAGIKSRSNTNKKGKRIAGPSVRTVCVFGYRVTGLARLILCRGTSFHASCYPFGM